jgi:alanine racemase
VFTQKQARLLTATVRKLEDGLGYPILKHFLNSAGIERFLEYQFDMVRLGISMYGFGNSKELQSVCSLKTTILQIQEVRAGDTIGYDRMSCVDRDSRIAVLPIGYADGLNRRLSNGIGEVIISGKRCPVIGNICMDTCMVDVTETEAKEGDEAIIFGKELSVVELAQQSGTIPYEILTAISQRVKRIYYKE